MFAGRLRRDAAGDKAVSTRGVDVPPRIGACTAALLAGLALGVGACGGDEDDDDGGSDSPGTTTLQGTLPQDRLETTTEDGGRTADGETTTESETEDDSSGPGSGG